MVLIGLDKSPHGFNRLVGLTGPGIGAPNAMVRPLASGEDVAMARLPKLSIAAKLYAIVGLLASATAVVGAVAVTNSRTQSRLLDEFESSFLGTQNVQLVNGLVYAVVMESRGIYMSPDIPTAKPYGANLLKFNDRITQLVADWRKTVQADDAEQFEQFSKRIGQFVEFRKELVR